MSSINPFSGYVAQGTQVERAEANDKTREARRAKAASQSVTRRDDELEHQVESADAVAAVHDDQQHAQQQSKEQQKQGDDKDNQTPPRLDVTA